MADRIYFEVYPRDDGWGISRVLDNGATKHLDVIDVRYPNEESAQAEADKLNRAEAERLAKS